MARKLTTAQIIVGIIVGVPLAVLLAWLAISIRWGEFAIWQRGQ